MRPLTEQETKILFEKLANYTTDLKPMIAPLSDAPDADRYVFRLIKDRVYYVLLSIANLATSIARDNLASVGICLGKFTKARSQLTSKFRLEYNKIYRTHARYKIWIKPNGVMPFLYGSHISKAHVGRWTEDCPSNVGVIVYDMSDSPIGYWTLLELLFLDKLIAESTYVTKILCLRVNEVLVRKYLDWSMEFVKFPGD
ncbi:hypothetical protein CHU98_g4928 [Xylaria longipes]|nr:hypothetical protein CHU98_g4928 [Xylaria longipes]